MNTTEHYQLNQWEGSDRILRTDFNADNRKTEEALAELAGAIAQKVGQAEVDATLQWVKIGEATLSEDSRTLSVTVPNAEQYRFFLLVMDLSSNLAVSLKWQSTNLGSLFSTDGSSVVSHGAGILWGAVLPLGGLFTWYAINSKGGGGERYQTNYKLMANAATSGEISIQLMTDSGYVMHAGSNLHVYGLRA